MVKKIIKTLIIAAILFPFFSFDSQYLRNTATQKTSNTLNGIWIPIRGETNGKELPQAAFEKATLTVVDSSYIRVDESGIGKGVFKYGNNKIDIYEKEGAMAGKHVKAIYKLQNEQLTICYDLEENTGGNYPISFDTKNNPTLRLLVFKKEKPK
jgi:uncharacterized protein (TIGR03067 family)